MRRCVRGGRGGGVSGRMPPARIPSPRSQDPPMAAIVAIVGRPNVGKSTLFNRLTRTRKAIVERVPGGTRDINTGEVEHRDHAFTLIDTGGFEEPSKVQRDSDHLLRQVIEQGDVAIEDADLLLVVLDAQEGITPG